MATFVVGDVNYGSTHDEELVVPLTLRDHNRTNTKHPSSTPSWTTKKLMCAGIMGMTAAVASSAMVLFTILDVSNQDSTALSFLLHASVGADDDNCVPASGPWPTGSVSTDYAAYSHFVTCFVSTTGGYCWSHSFYTGETWVACKPNGFGEAWNYDCPGRNAHLETCGTACTEFASDQNDDDQYN